MLPIRKKDKIVVKTGKDKGKTGEVLKVFSATSRVIVSKINFIKRHARATQTTPGGITEKESSIHISNVQLICPKCDQPTRVKIDHLSDGKKIRVCRRCGEMIV
ncbi:MAG: 50S ribosomal protein L24 [bacterium]